MMKNSVPSLVLGVVLALPSISYAVVDETLNVPEPATAVLLAAAAGVGVVIRGLKRFR
jgi:hypothetical protein